TAEASQLRHGLERFLETRRHVEDPDPAEVASRCRAQQIETQVRRRRPGGDARLGGPLEFVGGRARGGRTGSGPSGRWWGGGACPSLSTKVSKKRQGRRATSRRERVSSR